MLFSNLVATLRADLDAIKDDLGEFVTTVKTDTTAMLGLEANGANGATTHSNAAKMLQWEEELWDNPDLLCEDPEAEDWQTFVESNPVKDEEVEALLSGAQSDIIPDLYKELVPSKTTHADFFQRLVYHRNKMNQAVKVRMQELVMDDDEEETRWEDDDDPVAPFDEPRPSPITNVKSTSEVSAQDNTLIAQLKTENESLRSENSAIKSELESMKNELAEALEKLKALESKLAESASSKEAETVELPHKKVPSFPPTKLADSSSPEATVTPPVSGASWEALPTSPGSSSNEEPVMLNKTEAEEEEDDWE